ncbi:MAG TPA: hypothetical protein VFM78_09155 [Marinobacter sp.]|nr:hypothetical protein [Marinobacter sp.]
MISSSQTKGINVVRLNPQQLEVWQRAMQPLWAEYEPVIGTDIINAARQAGTLN